MDIRELTFVASEFPYSVSGVNNNLKLTHHLER